MSSGVPCPLHILSQLFVYLYYPYEVSAIIRCMSCKGRGNLSDPETLGMLLKIKELQMAELGLEPRLFSFQNPLLNTVIYTSSQCISIEERLGH